MAEQDPNLLNAKPENVERESEIMGVRAGAVTIAPTWPAVARTSSTATVTLKLREVLP